MQKRKFPQYLSSPFQILFLEMDDLSIMFTFFFLAAIFRRMEFFGIALVAPYFSIKIKKKYPRGYLKHVMYFLGIIRFKGYPSSFEIHFLE